MGWSVSTSTWARAIGSPIATARSQKPRRRSSSAAPARPACVTQAEGSEGSWQNWFMTSAYRWIAHLADGALSSAILVVADLLHPVDILAVDSLLDGDVRHARGGRSTVPVFHARPDPDDITR